MLEIVGHSKWYKDMLMIKGFLWEDIFINKIRRHIDSCFGQMPTSKVLANAVGLFRGVFKTPTDIVEWLGKRR